MSSDTAPGAENPTQAFYDRISKAYDTLADSNEQAAREQGLAALAVQPGETVLELGYGTGHSLVALAQAVGPNGRVEGIDISPGMRDVARGHVEQAGVSDRVELAVGDARRLPYADDHFDAVSMSFTLELFPLEDIPAVVAETRRVLKSGGRVGVVAMNTTPADEKESMLTHVYKWMHRHFPHWVDCQPIDAARYLTEGGLSITHQGDMQIWTLPVAILVATTPTG